MKLQELIQLKVRNKKRIGRGMGSGKGKTSGRGTKGQKARGKIPASFTGSMAFYKKLPLRRGFGNHKFGSNPKIVLLSKLNVFPARTTVDTEQLIKAKIITGKEMATGVKILGGSGLEKNLTVKLLVSKSAKAAIEAKGGKVENV